MVLFVAICDDEKRISAELERHLIKIFGDRNIKYKIDVYFSGVELCKKMEEGIHYDLLFLDIEFAKGEINGVQVGSIIRGAQQNNSVSIVYISWEKKYSLQLFDIQPLNFLIKPLKFEKVEQVMKRYLDIAKLQSGHFTYKIGHDSYKVQIKDIIYVESLDRKLILHLADGRQEKFYGSLKEEYTEQLQRFDFLFIHASFAVNYDYVKLHRYKEVALANADITLPISQDRRKAVREAYYNITERRKT